MNDMVGFNITRLTGITIGLAIFGWIGTIDIVAGFSQQVWSYLMLLHILLGLGLFLVYVSKIAFPEKNWMQSKIPYRYSAGLASAFLIAGLAESIAPLFITNTKTATLTQSLIFTTGCSVVALLLWFYESRAMCAKLRRMAVEQELDS